VQSIAWKYRNVLIARAQWLSLASQAWLFSAPKHQDSERARKHDGRIGVVRASGSYLICGFCAVETSAVTNAIGMMCGQVKAETPFS